MYLKLFNIFFWFIPYIQVTCLGLFFFKLFRFSLVDIKSLCRIFWFGMTGLVTCLEVIHFFLPVRGVVVEFFFALSLCGFLLSARELFQLVKKLSMRDW